MAVRRTLKRGEIERIMCEKENCTSSAAVLFELPDNQISISKQSPFTCSHSAPDSPITYDLKTQSPNRKSPFLPCTAKHVEYAAAPVTASKAKASRAAAAKRISKVLKNVSVSDRHQQRSFPVA
jgi:hypothetical protein